MPATACPGSVMGPTKVKIIVAISARSRRATASDEPSLFTTTIESSSHLASASALFILKGARATCRR